jgi:secreted trypsin-like serine protease
MGSSSSLGSYTVRLVGPFNCSGVAIARRYVATAAHCANRRIRVMGGGGSIAIAGVSQSVVLDDGRRVAVAGDAAILKLASPLPTGVSAPPIGGGEGPTFTIAGYGTTDERARGAFGSLHQANLVAAGSRALVDPNRSGTIGASACFGDSGGPVMRGGVLVGIITRANYPRKSIACGFYTRWAPVKVYGTASALSATEQEADNGAPRPQKSRAARHTEARTPASAPSSELLSLNSF